MRFVDRLLQGFRSFVLGEESLSTQTGRASPRILCHYRVNLRNDGREFDATITDIGITGMRIVGVPSLSRGERFEISYPFSDEFKEEHSFEVEVMWCRSRASDNAQLAGVRFIKQGEELRGSWVHLLLHEVGLLGDAVYQRRRLSRGDAQFRALVTEPKSGRKLLVGRVNNLSVGGALVESKTPLQAANQVLALLGTEPTHPAVSLSVRVLGCRLDSSDGNYLISLQFVDFTKEEFRALQELIVAMTEGRAPG